MTNVITLCNHKGGVGKTAITMLLAYILADMGKKVLLIDTDQQASLSSRFGFARDKEYENGSLVDALINAMLSKRARESAEKVYYADDFIQHTNEPNIDIIISNMNLAVVYDSFSKIENSSKQPFKKMIDELKTRCDYDYILMDTNPNVDIRNMKVFAGTDYYIVCAFPDQDSLLGVESVENLVEDIEDSNSDVELLGIILNNVDIKNNAAQMNDIVEASERYGDKIFNEVIPRSNYVDNLKRPEFGWRRGQNTVNIAVEKIVKEMEKRIGR